MSFTPTERFAICGTGALHPQTLRRLERGEAVRPVVIYRLKAALQTLGLSANPNAQTRSRTTPS